MLNSVSERYINQIVSNLRDRFDDVGLRVIVPSNIVSDTSKVAKFGESEIGSFALISVYSMTSALMSVYLSIDCTRD